MVIMGWLKEAGRLVNGVSLIAKEIVKDSQALQAAKNGDLPNLIKIAIVSATDLSGLTKGKLHHLSKPTSSSSNLDSVVYFTSEDSTPQQQQPQPQPQPQPSSFNSVIENDINDNTSEASTSSSEKNLDFQDVLVKENEPQDSVHKDNTQVVVALKRRKPRERRVPSTPFSRALG
jgi:aarF domain-containing kinase